MCGIYGVLSYKNGLKDIDKLTKLLAEESADRGVDATGIAYVVHRDIRINKKAVSAYKFKTNIPKNVKAVIGHTRHSTQGDCKFNANNHPWKSNVSNCSFALAHNGVLMNDGELQRKYGFKSKIETDSYIAVQLIKFKNRLNMDSIRFMAEAISGSFSFNILDSHNNIYLVKGDSPICLLHFKEKGVYVFASTAMILWRALIESELFDELQNGRYEQMHLNEGEILKICADGKRESDRFKYREFYGSRWYEMCGSSQFGHMPEGTYLNDLRAVASSMGVDPDVIEELHLSGYSYDEIEDLLYYPELIYGEEV